MLIMVSLCYNYKIKCDPEKKKKKKKFGVKGRGKRVREPHGWVAKGSFPEKVLLKLSPVR